VNDKKILFPTDFSHTGDAALQLATSLAREHDATLLIVHVEEPPAAYGGGEMYYGMPDPVTRRSEKMLSEIVPTDPTCTVRTSLITGDPATAIARLAEQEGAEMIVMGTHGRTGATQVVDGQCRRGGRAAGTLPRPDSEATPRFGQ
jgi:universal stress protein A